MSKVSNVVFGATAILQSIMFGLDTLLCVIIGIAALSNGMAVFGIIALVIGIICGLIGAGCVIQAAKNVNARQAARAAQAPSASEAITQPIPIQPAAGTPRGNGNVPQDDGKTPLT